MKEAEDQAFEDLMDLTEKSNQISLAAMMDAIHINNPERQIKTLGIMVNELLQHNELGQNNMLIGFYTNIGKSLKQLIKLQTKD